MSPVERSAERNGKGEWQFSLLIIYRPRNFGKSKENAASIAENSRKIIVIAGYL
jgi:hypothetical protein